MEKRMFNVGEVNLRMLERAKDLEEMKSAIKKILQDIDYELEQRGRG